MSLVVESRSGHHDAWRQHDQSLEAAAVKRKILDALAVDHRADGPRLRIHYPRTRFYRHGHRRIAERHLEVDPQSILDVQSHVRLHQLLKTPLFDFDAVRARREIRQAVFARGVRRRFIANIRRSVDGGDFGIGDQGVGWICDAARKRGIGGLRRQEKRECKPE